jgi:hypothetical protein
LPNILIKLKAFPPNPSGKQDLKFNKAGFQVLTPVVMKIRLKSTDVSVENIASIFRV